MDASGGGWVSVGRRGASCRDGYFRGMKRERRRRRNQTKADLFSFPPCLPPSLLYPASPSSPSSSSSSGNSSPSPIPTTATPQPKKSSPASQATTFLLILPTDFDPSSFRFDNDRSIRPSTSRRSRGVRRRRWGRDGSLGRRRWRLRFVSVESEGEEGGDGRGRRAD